MPSVIKAASVTRTGPAEIWVTGEIAEIDGKKLGT
jgi:hypothetical protein